MSIWLGQRNLARQYDFMNTSFILWEAHQKPIVTLEFLRELNFYAVHMLSPGPGVIRSQLHCNVTISETDHVPPDFSLVDGYMVDFFEKITSMYSSVVPVKLAAYALWRLNWIHPFMQGNGRSSRALCYFLICQRYSLWFAGTPLHELIRQNRQEYCKLLNAADKTVTPDHLADLTDIEAFLERLMAQQIASIPTD